MCHTELITYINRYEAVNSFQEDTLSYYEQIKHMHKHNAKYQTKSNSMEMSISMTTCCQENFTTSQEIFEDGNGKYCDKFINSS